MIYIYCMLCVLVLMIQFLLRKNKSRLSKFKNRNIQKDINDIKVKYKPLYGKVYAYNPRKNKIIIVDKEEYNLYDYFAIYHEIGHYKDNQKNKITYWMNVIAVYRLILIPCTVMLLIFHVCITTIPLKIRFFFIGLFIFFYGI